MIHHGDCLDVMASLDAESVDAIVTDPPYGLEFMGKHWDHGVPGIAFWREMFRVAKPSAYLLAFGGTRTVHRLTVAIEDAGWIIRDMLVWAYASGFPKSKASLKPAWEPIVMARKPGPLRMLAIDECRIGTAGGGTDCTYFPDPCLGHGDERSQSGPTVHTIRPTARIDAWENEPSRCVSCAEDADFQARLGVPATRGSTTPRRAERQPNDSATSGDTSRAATGCFHGMTPASGGSSSNTDESGRTPTGLFLSGSLSTISTRTSSTTGSRTCTCCGGAITPTTTSGTPFDTEMGPPAPTTSASTGSVGRWPSNVLLTDPIFDGGWDGVVGGGGAVDAGVAVRRNVGISNANHLFGAFAGTGPLPDVGYGDAGTYSRFFLVPKADRSDREPTLGKEVPQLGPLEVQSPGRLVTAESRHRTNHHPTVKPVDLMRHLVRLVTPAGGTVLDPFGGSGTTALACELEGFPWILVEKEAEYVAIAEARLNGTQRGLGLVG